jgi:hypothetical protein
VNLPHFLATTAALAALTLPSFAAEPPPLRQTPGSQITVTQCYPHQHTAYQAHPWVDPYGHWHYGGSFPYDEGFLAITYVNNASAVVKEIDFGLIVRDAMIAVVNDVGTFSTGTTIDHEFSVSREIFPIGTEFPYCAVLRVQYADGTVWTNPNY